MNKKYAFGFVIFAVLISGIAVALFAGLLTLMSMVKIWNEGFCKPAPSPNAIEEPTEERRRRLGWMIAPMALLAAVTVTLGLFPQPLFHLAEQSARELTTPEVYQRAVGLEDTATQTPFAPEGGEE